MSAHRRFRLLRVMLPHALDDCGVLFADADVVVRRAQGNEPEAQRPIVKIGQELGQDGVDAQGHQDQGQGRAGQQRQQALGGGRLDPGETPVEAALREAQEELGIDPRDVRVIGETDRFRTRTGFDITPVLATIPADLPLVPNPAEVAEWFEPPFRYILDPANQQEQEVHWEGAMRRYTEIHWQGHRIWGVTAAIIVNLTRRLALAERDA